MFRIVIPLVLIFLLGSFFCSGRDIADIKSKLPNDLQEEPPTVLIVLLVRNKDHVLPMFLSYLEAQIYPKDRIALWIRSDHNIDNSIELLNMWLNHIENLYHSVSYLADNTTKQYQNETSPYDWSLSRFQHIIKLKEEAMTYGQKIWADFIFYLDADVLLTSRNALTELTKLRLPVVAPMLLSEGLYSNFWAGMTDEYYYQRTEEYLEIYNLYEEGVFNVPMIHSAVMIDLNYMGARYLTYDRDRLIEQQENDKDWAQAEGLECRTYTGPLDDIIIFAISANSSNIPLMISNQHPYGYILQPLESGDDLQQDKQQLTNIRTNMVQDLDEVPPVHDYLEPYIKFPEKHKLTLNNIYMINLERRPERRQKMENLFAELGLDVEYFPAVDGKQLNSKILTEMGIKILANYEDPYFRRPMTMGEIGCFLSHYRIWEKIVKYKQKEVLILEDDIRFEPYFKDRAERILEQARNLVEYDLIYFGRKRLKNENEPLVAGTENLVHAGYSYWTIGYVISLQGARKLLNAKPLKRLMPVDEFLPLMFNRHPNNTWSSEFSKRNLIAFSAVPLILYPTHYTGEFGYISDTEDSAITPNTIYSYAADTKVQLKSDRELEFPQEGNAELSSIGKMHDEF